MSINSKKKGSAGERELASKLREYGYNCRRGQQYNGLEGEDVVGLDYIHIECKRVQALNLDEAMEQSKRDSTSNQLPAVFHRKNNKKWKVTMELESWIKLYNEYYSSMKLEESVVTDEEIEEQLNKYDKYKNDVEEGSKVNENI